jgi:murein DD-endopeptidase MepM/ murein hydrolase activator NlpD
LGEHDHFFFTRPIAADEINWPLPDYRYGGVFFSPDVVHTGIDIDAAKGADVIAAASGEVIWAGYGLLYGQENHSDPYGLAIAIRHDFGVDGQRLYTIYAHMSEIMVVDGQYVKLGENIGKVGSTGHTTGPHLHFEVRLGANVFGATRNPELWLAPPQGWGVLAGRILDLKGNPRSHVEVKVEEVDGNRNWYVRTYSNKIINPDDYFAENLVLSDLPAGKYNVRIEYEEKYYRTTITIYPGAITFFVSKGEKGYDLGQLPEQMGNP